MNELVDDSLEYPQRSDAFRRIIAIGGVFTFVELGALDTFLTIAGPVVLTGSFLDSVSMASQLGLVALGFVSLIVSAEFRVRIVERVIPGEESPSGVTDGPQLLFDGVLYCVTLLAVIAVPLATGLSHPSRCSSRRSTATGATEIDHP